MKVTWILSKEGDWVDICKLASLALVWKQVEVLDNTKSVITCCSVPGKSFFVESSTMFNEDVMVRSHKIRFLFI